MEILFCTKLVQSCTVLYLCYTGMSLYSILVVCCNFLCCASSPIFFAVNCTMGVLVAITLGIRMC